MPVVDMDSVFSELTSTIAEADIKKLLDNRKFHMLQKYVQNFMCENFESFMYIINIKN